MQLWESTAEIEKGQIEHICIQHMKLGPVAVVYTHTLNVSWVTFSGWHRCLSYQIWYNWQVLACKGDIPSLCQAEWRQTPVYSFLQWQSGFESLEVVQTQQQSTMHTRWTQPKLSWVKAPAPSPQRSQSDPVSEHGYALDLSVFQYISNIFTTTVNTALASLTASFLIRKTSISSFYTEYSQTHDQWSMLSWCQLSLQLFL